MPRSSRAEWRRPEPAPTLLVRCQRREPVRERTQKRVALSGLGEVDGDRTGVFRIRPAHLAAQEPRDHADAVAREERGRPAGLRRGDHGRGCDALQVGFEAALHVGLRGFRIGDVERAATDEEPAVALEDVVREGVAHEVELNQLRGVEVGAGAEGFVLRRGRALLRTHADIEQRRGPHGAILKGRALRRDVSDRSFRAPPSVDTMGAMTHEGAEASVDSVEPTRWERAAALFLRWRDGDSRAMDELVRLMTPLLWHVVRAYGLDRALAEDVVQTTWLTLVRRHESITEPQAVSGWLTMVARREAWRVGKLQRRADATETESLEPHLPAQESAEQTAATDDESRRLWLAVGAAQRSVPAPAAHRRVRGAPRLRPHRAGHGDADRIDRADASALSRKLRALLEGDGWGGDSNGD